MSRPHLPRNHRDRRSARPTARRARPAPEPLEDRTLLSFGFLAEYPLPTRSGQTAGDSSKPWDITLGPDHNLWFTEQDPKFGNRIGRITPAGAITEFSQGLSTMAWPSGISANPYDDRVYFTEFRGNRVGILDTSQQTITELPLMPDDSQPADTFFVEPNDVYISQSNSNGFSELDIFANPTFIPCDSSSSCPTPSTPDSGPWGMASDNNDYFYFTERFAGRIGVYGIDASTGQGKTFEFETPSHQQGKPSQPLSIVEGPDGNLWYTDFMADAIGKITPLDPKTNQVTITEYPLAAGSRPWGITPGPGGFLYFTENGGNAIGRIDPGSGAIEVDPLPHPDRGPRGIAVDSNGILWFTETNGNAIGQYLVLSFAPQQPFGTGLNPVSVAVGDFNGDHKPDLAVANIGDVANGNGDPGDVSVLINTTMSGSTTSSFAPQQTFAAGRHPTDVAVGDFNGDGKPDLAVANIGSGNVSVLLNTTAAGSTTPSFAPSNPSRPGPTPLPCRWPTSTATASPISPSPTESRV